MRFISDERWSERVSPDEYDDLLSAGWRHFGPQFFRYSLNIFDGRLTSVIPLRVRTTDFTPSKSQRRNLKRNADLSVEISDAAVDDETAALFEKHRIRLEPEPPDSIFQFISPEPNIPCRMLMVAVRDRGRLVAASFFGNGNNSCSGVYAMFDPEHGSRGLGIFTMLTEIEYARATNRQFYYQGYCYAADSFYDYKKRFGGTEAFDWNGNWRPLERHLSELPAIFI